MEGPRGASDITIDLATGAVEASLEPARLVDTLNDLHRGKNAGQAWRSVIDPAVSLVALVGIALGLTP
jgi:hypothetical protein